MSGQYITEIERREKTICLLRHALITMICPEMEKLHEPKHRGRTRNSWPCGRAWALGKDTRKHKVPIFKRRINPAFHRHPKEGNAVGRLIVAFGELELHLAMIAARNSGKYETTMRVLYRLRTTSTRIALTDVFLRPAADKRGIIDNYNEARRAIDNCLEIRNRYAHAQWADDPQRRPGLFFSDMQKAADAAEGFWPMHLHVSLRILRLQDAYFVYAQDCLFYLEEVFALQERGETRAPLFDMPPKLQLPTAHSDPRKYVPRWLSPVEQARHLERARAMIEGIPAPTPKQKALDEARAKKRAKREADRRRDLATKNGDP